MNDAFRRHQLAPANLVAFSMIPPVPDSRRLHNSQLQLAKVYAPWATAPISSFLSHLSAVISRDSLSTHKAGSGRVI